MFTNKILLITGRTGTFGNVALRNFLKTDVKEVRIFSRDEKSRKRCECFTIARESSRISALGGFLIVLLMQWLRIILSYTDYLKRTV